MKVKGLHGTIFQFRDLWYYNLRQNGERFRIPLGTKDKADAIAAAREKVIKELIPDRPLKDLQPRDADKFFDDLAARRRKDHQGNIVPNEITGHGKNLYLRFLRMLWNQAITWKMADENPFKRVTKFSTETKLPRVLDDAELTKVFKSMMKLYPNLADIIMFLLFTGMRRTEAITLKWLDIDLEKGLIHLTRTKGHKERIVPIFAIPREILERRKGLPSPFADVQSGQNLTRKFGEIVKDAGIPHAKLHDLRKTFGTMLASNNVSACTIMRWMGHSDSNVTLNHYIGMDKEAMKKIEASIRTFGDPTTGPSALPN
jgi:integrase